MFIHTHIYLFHESSFDPNNLSIIGSFLPDLALNKVIKWNDLHQNEKVQEFSKYVGCVNNQYQSLIVGINCHNIVDRLSDVEYSNDNGYAYKNITQELIKIVGQGCNLEDERLKIRTAHNFIELAVDMFVLQKNPSLLKIKESSINSSNICDISKLLSGFFNLDQEKVRRGILDYFSLMYRYDIRDIDNAVLFWEEINKLLFERDVNKEMIKEGIIISKRLIVETYDEFLKIALQESRKVST